jgi:FkbM family methyltransferase
MERVDSTDCVLHTGSTARHRHNMLSFTDRVRQTVHLARVLVRDALGRKYEPEVPFMDRFVRSNSLCVHVGASDGRHALYLSRRVPEGIVHCIEASPYTLGVLQKICKLRGVRNMRLHNFAVGAADGEAYLITPIKPSGHRGRAFAFISPTKQEKPLRPSEARFIGFDNQKLPLRSLDSFCAEQGLKGIAFLRCDIEGAEILLLDGGAATIERDRPVVMMEVHPQFLRERFGRSSEEVWQWFADRNFSMFYLKGDDLVHAERFLDEPWRDYFCVPNEHLQKLGLAAKA